MKDKKKKYKFDYLKPARAKIRKSPIKLRNGEERERTVDIVVTANKLGPFEVAEWTDDHHPKALRLRGDTDVEVLSFEQD